ncbi:MAG: YiiX/YebB-like N1pC/P60 family cysteine hydrolase [Candidatus Geothermincolia bacterium]
MAGGKRERGRLWERSRGVRRSLPALLLAGLMFAPAISRPPLGRLPVILEREMSRQEFAAASEPLPDAAVASLSPGDILLGRCEGSFVPSGNPHDNMTHAAMYIGNSQVVEAGNPSSGVTKRPLEAWLYPKMTWVTYIRIPAATDEMRRLACSFMLSQVGKPYDIVWYDKQPNGPSWYCSEIVWAAYLFASGGAIDLEGEPDMWGVHPDEIARYGGAVSIGGHYEYKPVTFWSALFITMRHTFSFAMLLFLATCLIQGVKIWRWRRRLALPAFLPGALQADSLRAGR